jgi:hypothetical protein
LRLVFPSSNLKKTDERKMTGRMLVEHTLKGRQTRPDVDNFRLLLALYASSPTISFLAGLKVESG